MNVTDRLQIRTTAGLLALLLLALAPPAGAEGLFTDPQDGRLDASEWLLDRKGFLPVPIIITEPAVGFGLGVGALFVRESIRERQGAAKGGRPTPPDVFGVAMAATENGTRFLGGGGLFSFDEDRWRYRGGVAKTHVNLDFYGLGATLNTGEFKLGYNLDGLVSSQQLMRRLGASDHFVAVRWAYLDIKSRFDGGPPLPVAARAGTRTTSSGAGLAWEYDTRDNIFTPSKGMVAGFDALFYSPSIGSDDTFQTYRAHVYGYLPLARAYVLGLRADGRTAHGDAPFYQLPFIDLRGISAARYQDRSVAMTEAELRWHMTPRWALVGFAGAGRAWGARDGDAVSVGTVGAGVRYLIARRLGMYVGVDAALGPDGAAYYIQVGSAWR
jgi:hypothetical protein